MESLEVKYINIKGNSHEQIGLLGRENINFEDGVEETVCIKRMLNLKEKTGIAYS